MKLFIFLISILTIIGCGNNSPENEIKSADNSAQEAPNSEIQSPTTQTDEIVGEWELTGSVQDTNDNLLIDEEERKNLTPMSYQDYMKLNSNGTGLFTIAKMEGRYEIEENNGKRSLTWYDKGNGKHRIGTIVSVSKTELHIKEPGGNGLFLWKRS